MHLSKKMSENDARIQRTRSWHSETSNYRLTMRDLANLTQLKPHHSQLHNKYELMCVDDDPVFQVILAFRFGRKYVDSSLIWQVVTKGLLRSLGFEVVRALSGNEALELLRTRNHLPDLILLDVEMPTESGYEVHYCVLIIVECRLNLLF